MNDAIAVLLEHNILRVVKLGRSVAYQSNPKIDWKDSSSDEIRVRKT